MILLDLL